MRHIVIHMPDRPMSDIELCRWIGEAAPGDALEYHHGFLAIDIDTISRPVAEQKALRLLARRAMWAVEAGFVHLVQRRVGPPNRQVGGYRLLLTGRTLDASAKLE